MKYERVLIAIATLTMLAGCSTHSSIPSTSLSHTAAPHPAGYGAFVDDWNSTHTDDIESGGTGGESNTYTGQMPNYNPDPSLPLYGGYDPNDTYYDVSALDGRVTQSYSGDRNVM